MATRFLQRQTEIELAAEKSYLIVLEEALYIATLNMINSVKEVLDREIKKCCQRISNLITMINRLPFNWLLSYIILAFHRDRYSPRYTSTADEDSSTLSRFQLSNYGAAKGMLGLSFHS